MSVYSQIDYVLSAPFAIGINMIRKANEQYAESRIWEMWLANLPRMDQKNFVSFSDYRDGLLASDRQKQQTPEEMMSVCRMLNAAMGGTVVEV